MRENIGSIGAMRERIIFGASSHMLDFAATTDAPDQMAPPPALQRPHNWPIE